jgi:hypothetical protein
VGAPPRPALARLVPSRRTWRVALGAVVGERLLLEARLCPPSDDGCSALSAEGDVTHPGGAARGLASDIAALLDVPVGQRPELPSAPPSPDPYAVLLLGRSAATLLGRLPAPGEDARGDPREDPFERAVFVDPGMPLGWSLLARSAKDADRRLAALERLRDPSPGHLADLAAVRSDAGRAEDAWAAWSAYARVDPRFAASKAIAAARAAPRAELFETLSALPADLAADPSVSVRIEVALAERRGEAPDALLAEWQRLAPQDPRPVRRRLARRLEDGAFGAALDLAPELAARGAPDEAHQLTLALASNLGDKERAAAAARALGRHEVARRLRADARPDPLLFVDARSPELRLREAERLLDRLAPQRALHIVQDILQDQPWWPEALDVERRAWAALGEARRAAEVKARVRFADPSYYEERAP